MSRSLRFFGAIVLLASGCGEAPPAPAPTVGVAEVIRGEFLIVREDHERQVRDPLRVENEAAAVTGEDGRGILRLDNGAWLVLDRGTRSVVELERVTLESGRMWVDASNGTQTEIVTPHGSLETQDATYAVEMRQDEVHVYCASGELTWRSDGADGQLARGEELVLGAGVPEPRPAGVWDDWTGGLADPSPRAPQGASYVGVLTGRRVDEHGRARTLLPIRAHEVNARIDGDIAATEVTQTFFNARSDHLEAEYILRLPPGAIVQGAEVDLGSGVYTDAHISTVQDQRTAGVVNVYQDSSFWEPAASGQTSFSYDGTDRIRARLYPIAPGATVRVKLQYTEWLDRSGEMRTWVYPMESGTLPPLIGEFSLEVDTRDSGAGDFRAGMGATVEAGRIVLSESDFRPRSDFYLDLVDSEESEFDPSRARAYVVDGMSGSEWATDEDEFVLIDLPTPDSESGAPEPLDLLILVDASGGTSAEDLELARAVVEAVLRQLTPTDRVALQLADLRAHSPEGAPDGLTEATEANRERILEAMARVDLGGATDLGASLRDAAQLVAGRPRGAVLYLGDAIPTTGEMTLSGLRRTLATVDAPPRFFALGIGDASNVDLLKGLFGERARAVRERTQASRAVMRVLAEAARPTLRQVEVELGPSVERVYPRGPLEVSSGQRLRVIGRLRDELPSSIRLRGLSEGDEFEEEISLERVSVDDGGDIRRRWAVSRLGDLIDEEAGREALVELGMRFGVITPWTCLVMGGAPGVSIKPVRGFHRDPATVPWSLGGRGAGLATHAFTEGSGWRRRSSRATPTVFTAPEQTWLPRVQETGDEVGPPPAGDGGLTRAAVVRALARGERGPRACFERRLMVRPDLRGDVRIEVEVDGAGRVLESRVLNSEISDAEVERCMLSEVRGIRFPSSGGSARVTVAHLFHFVVPERSMGARRQCNEASRQSVSVRRMLWREQLDLQGNPGSHGALGEALRLWRRAEAGCELQNWRARRTLLRLMFEHVGNLQGRIRLYHSYPAYTPMAAYLRRIILQSARTTEDVNAIRALLTENAEVDWSFFSRAWRRAAQPSARLSLVRRWLEVFPEEMDLRLRLLALLEETERLPEARRLARELRADPLADLRVRSAVGEFWLRQEEPGEARRVFSEIVERAPLDPWTRRGLGDLYRAHGWSDDAYREYQTLARLRPADPTVFLSLARAAAAAGRTDEALRLEQRLSERAVAHMSEGPAGFARVWTAVRLARMKDGVDDPETLRAIRRRERSTGALRAPPQLFATLTWEHPEDQPGLFVRYPGADDDDDFEHVPLRGGAFGIEALSVREREEGAYRFEVRREDRDRLRDTEAELLIILGRGTPDERVVRAPVRLSREERVARFRLTASGELESVADWR